MKLNINDMGERLHQFRKALNLHQKDLAEKAGVNQNQVSRLENGLGASFELVMQLVNFYNDYFHVTFLFAENFEVIKKSDAIKEKNPYFNIALERLKVIKDDFGGQITEIIDILEKEEIQ